MIKGWLIENNPEEWQELIKYPNQMWALAEFWQLLNSENIPTERSNSTGDSVDKIDRELLRKSLLYTLEHNKHKGINRSHRIYWA